MSSVNQAVILLPSGREAYILGGYEVLSLPRDIRVEAQSQFYLLTLGDIRNQRAHARVRSYDFRIALAPSLLKCLISLLIHFMLLRIANLFLLLGSLSVVVWKRDKLLAGRKESILYRWRLSHELLAVRLMHSMKNLSTCLAYFFCGIYGIQTAGGEDICLLYLRLRLCISRQMLHLKSMESEGDICNDPLTLNPLQLSLIS